jgi:acetyl-CoA synthetase
MSDQYNMAVDVLTGREPGRVAMLWADHRGARASLTWAELAASTNRFGALLRDRGTGRGDRVALVLPALPETAAAALGALRIGAILVVMSALWQRDAIAYRLRDCTARVVITDQDHESVVRAAVAAAGTGTTVVVLAPELLDGLPDDTDPVPTHADDPALISYTSGTTGPAKGIVHAHRRLLGHNEFEVCHDLQPSEVFHGAGDWAWSLMKLFGPWRVGAVQFVYQQGPRFDPVALFTAMAAHDVTNTLLNPGVVRRLRQADPEAGAQIPLRLRIACCSSEPLPADLLTWFQDQFGVTLLDYYGCTESYPMISNRPGVLVKPGSMGMPTPGWQVALLDRDGTPAPPGSPGEVCLRARSNPQYPLGYWNRPEASAATFGGTWWHTNDLARIDGDGYWWYLGRADDVIISSGYRIGPYDVENVLDAHPAVSASAVVGVPDAERGQVVCAFVVPAAGVVTDQPLIADLQAHVRERYAPFAYPRRIEFVPSLPISTTNKIQRGVLRRRLTDDPDVQEES